MNEINELTFEQAHKHVKTLSFFKQPRRSTNNNFWLTVTVGKINGINGRHMFDLHKTENSSNQRPHFRVRTRNKTKGGRRVSGKIVSVNKDFYLLHDPKQVNNKNNRPRLTNKIVFKGKEFSSFLIDDNLVNKLTEYHLSRPKFKLQGHTIESAENESTEPKSKERREVWIKSIQRGGKFRKKLLNKYTSTCCVTGYKTTISLEAAHLTPVADGGSDDINNGILLRIDIHRIFDAGLMAINPKTFTIHFSKDLKNEYCDFDRKSLAYELSLSTTGESALKERWGEFEKKYLN